MFKNTYLSFIYLNQWLAMVNDIHNGAHTYFAMIVKFCTVGNFNCVSFSNPDVFTSGKVN